MFMTTSRRAVALLALALSSATLPAAGLAADACQNPSFRIAPGSPFQLRPVAGADAAQPAALAAGNYVARPGAQPGSRCGCDLVVGLITQDASPQGFLVRLRGNDDATFTGTPDTLQPLDGFPAAIASDRFGTNLPVDVLVVVTSGAGNGQAEVFIPDLRGNYPKNPSAVFPVGANPVAVTTGDFDGDGLLDVAVINQDDSSLSILFGTGMGTFSPNVFTVPLGASPESVTAGKFSGSSVADDIAVGVVLDHGGSSQAGVLIVQGIKTRQLTVQTIPLGQPNSLRPLVAAANLSGQAVGALGRLNRDLAVAFTDRTTSGEVVGRIKVLLGRDNGLFDLNATQTLDIGATEPRSIKVVDLDADGVVDLIVSAFAHPSQLDGTVHFFQGHAAPDPQVGFQANSNWSTIPETTGILPRALVAGPFGNHSPGRAIANMGVAAINASDLNSILVLPGNGQGAFTQPTLVTTPFSPDDHLFVSGDFHSADAAGPLQDLAFITKANGQNVLSVRQSNGAGGFAPIDPALPALVAGISPSLIVAGQFVPNGPLSVAIIDAKGAIGEQPLLKIFLGQGNGLMKAGGELPLTDIGVPSSIAVGHFRGAGMPLDIAVASDTTPPGSGKVTLLRNDGHGAFSIDPDVVVPLTFVPGALAVSSRLSASGMPDLLVRDARANRFQFFVNIGNGFRLPTGAHADGFFPDAGNFNALLVGNVAHGASDRLDDVVTFDSDMTLRIFVNNGSESFDVHTVAPGNDPHFVGAQPPYVLAEFGSGTPALAAPVVRDGNFGLLVLQGDGTGKFTPATGEVPLQAVRGTTSDKPLTSITQGFPNGFPSVGRVVNVDITQTMAAQFHSALHGNSLPDLVVISKVQDSFTNASNCPGDNTGLPRPKIPFPPATCKDKVDCGDDGPKKKKGPPQQCFLGDCCFCNTGPMGGRCPQSCTLQPMPFKAFCSAFLRYTPAAAVYANTCRD
jgi:hypothetical protein